MKETILVVEDDPNIRESLVEIFNLAGYEVEAAKDGKEGYHAILDNCPDLVVCDVSMPELDGFELLGAINQRLKDQVIPPFLFLTAKVELKDIRHGMSLGADDYILKPFDHTQLLDIVRMRLDKRKKLLESQTDSIESMINHPHNTFNKLALPNEEGLTLVPFDEIVKCEADRAYCSFHLKSGKSILVSKSMKEFETILLSHNFLKVHKSTIVNINYAEKYLRGKGGQLLMVDGSLVPVSVRKKDDLMKVLKS